ncbi:MAG: DNA helicase RecG, partial [Verrucomicrobiaceae bacterium]
MATDPLPTVFSALEDLVSLSLLPAKEAAALAAAGHATAAQLLDHIPKRYEDRRRFDRFPTQATAQPVCLRGTVIDAGMRFLGPGRRFYEAVVLDGTGGIFGSGKITCRWFNMPFIQKLIATGHDVIVYGKVKDTNGRLIIDHPEFEVVKDDDSATSIHIERIVPIYRNISGISQRRLREIIHLLLLQIDPSSLVPVHEVDAGFPRVEALRQVHFPESLEQGAAARRRLALEEFFALQLNVVWRRARYQEKRGRVLGKKTTSLTKFYESLPFDLT